MLSFVKTSANTIVVTLAEKTTLTGTVYYLWKFVNDQDGSIDYCIATDLSLYKDRFNEFSITTNTYFNTALNGQYDYQIYEQVSTSNLNPTGLNELESGIMELIGTPLSYTEYTTTDTFNIRQ